MLLKNTNLNKLIQKVNYLVNGRGEYECELRLKNITICPRVKLGPQVLLYFIVSLIKTAEKRKYFSYDVENKSLIKETNMCCTVILMRVYFAVFCCLCWTLITLLQNAANSSPGLVVRWETSPLYGWDPPPLRTQPDYVVIFTAN